MQCSHGYGKRSHCATCRDYDRRNVHDFAWALDQLRDGQHIARAGWRDRDARIALVPQGAWSAAHIDRKNEQHSASAFIAISTPDGGAAPWMATHSDLLASDWVVV